ncbi:MAG: response regulator transcription factor [Rhodospirillaceae bacterium]
MAWDRAAGSPALGERRSPEFGSLRLLVADDHPLILESIKAVFKVYDSSIEVLGFTDIRDLEVALGTDAPPPDLVLIDFNMPGLASLDAISGFMGRHPGRRVAVISGHVDSHLAREVIRLGCLGFVPKSLAPTAVYHAIRLMTNGDRYLPDFLFEPSAPANTSEPPAPPGRQKHGLTRREVEVLRALVTGHTNKQIARDLAIEEVTVKLHLRRGYAKLNVRNRIEAVRAVLEGALD